MMTQQVPVGVRSCAMPVRLIACLVWLAGAADLCGAEPPREPAEGTARLREPTPIEDDANLHDVQFVGSKRGWAVGDHGVIWHSGDGGETWILQSSGVGCPLRSVCFLSDRVGWVAGGGTVPFTRRSYGVLLHTSDGGQTWRTLVSPPAICSRPGETRQAMPAQTLEKQKAAAKTILPRIRKIKFFSLEEGIAVGEGAGSEPSGAFVTDDGGKSWHAMTGPQAPGWLSAEFLNRDAGILVGVRDSLGMALEGAVSLPRFEASGLRGRHAIALDRERSGWIVGDGGLVLRTDNDGIVWQAPPRPLPPAIREAFDFRTVANRDGHVWIAGQPGSAVWHSADAGRSWQMQRTGQTVGIARLCFTSPQHGWGVGALGTILRTTDGGRTWRAVRGDGRRVALLSLFGSTRQVSLGLVAEMSAEQGYRSLVSVIARDAETGEGINEAEAGDRIDEAVTGAGGSAGHVGWRLPLAIPGLERDHERLIDEWNRRTENRLDEVLSAALVRQLRMWRPSVLIIDDPETGGPLAKLIGEAAKKAVASAADSTSFLEFEELAGLEPWQVQKVFVRLPAGRAGDVNVEPFRYLPHVGETTSIVAATALGLFFDDRELKVPREAYRLLEDSGGGRKGTRGRTASTGAGLFSGIALGAGGPARRAALPFDDTHLEARQKATQKLRNFASYSEQMLEDPRRAGQLIAQIPDLARGLSASETAWQLMHLAEQYQEVGQWELAELALTELAERFPDQPAALRAVQRLMQSWGSSEVTWRRLRKSSTELKRQQNRPDLSVPRALDYAQGRLKKQSQKIQRTVFNSDDEEPDDVLPNSSSQPVESAAPATKYVTHRDLDRKQRYWQTRALKLFAELSRRDGALAAEPQTQFSLAAIHRQRTEHLKADQIYRRFAGTANGSPWAQAADGELWLTSVANPPTGPVARCGFTAARPVLDGVLSDPCWQMATELPLAAGPQERQKDGHQSRAALCFDREHLYFAARLPRAEGFRTDGTSPRDRRHDEDLAEFDRIVLSLDVDRDYLTSFNFIIDQRGCTNDSCWHDTTWDPRWFVAVMGDETEWRVEAAIPLEELVPYIPGRGMAWSVGITRITPAVGLESWTHPAAAAPRPECFGLLRFETAGDSR